MRVALALFLVGCGGMVVGADGGIDSGSADGSPADAGWTPCTSPQGYAVCGGTSSCSPPNCSCGDELDGVEICLGHAGSRPDPYSNGPCNPGLDGFVCMLTTIPPPFPDAASAKEWITEAFELAELIASNGGSDRLRYADLGKWTGDPIPDAVACVPIGGVDTCGGKCGACSGSATCVGRSPLHPIGICDPNHSMPCSVNPKIAGYSCQGSNACFTYIVEPDAQSDADGAGICLPTDACNALASQIPGGGKCGPSL